MSGEVKILPGWDGAHPIAVMQWSRHRDSGFLLGCFADRREAVRFARSYAAENDCEFWNADVVEFARAKV